MNESTPFSGFYTPSSTSPDITFVGRDAPVVTITFIAIVCVAIPILAIILLFKLVAVLKRDHPSLYARLTCSKERPFEFVATDGELDGHEFSAVVDMNNSDDKAE